MIVKSEKRWYRCFESEIGKKFQDVQPKPEAIERDLGASTG